MSTIITAFTHLRYIVRTPTGKFLVGLYALITALVGVGFVSSRYSGAEGWISQFSISGLEILVTAIMLTPLTAFAVEASRSIRLRPTKEALFRALTIQYNGVARRNLHFAALLGFHANALTLDTGLDSIEDLFENAKRSLERITASVEKSELPPKADPQKESRLAQALKNAEGIRRLAIDHSDWLRRDLEQIDNTLLFCIPIFGTDSLSALSTLREKILSYKQALSDLHAFLSGVDQKDMSIMARLAYLDFQLTFDNLKTVSVEVGLENQVSTLAKDVDELASGVRFAPTIASINQLVDTIVWARGISTTS